MENESAASPKSKSPILRKTLKATFKGIILYAVYLVLSQFLAPVSQFVPGFQQIVETFVMVYIILMIIAELTSGSILQYFFDAAKILFTIAYLVISFGTGLFEVNFPGLHCIIDIHTFLVIAMLLSLVGLAKSVLQTVDYMNRKAEIALAPDTPEALVS